MSAALSLTILSLAVQAAAEDRRHADVLRKHEASFGGHAAVAAVGDLYLEGTIQSGQLKGVIRSWIRRKPFAMREELELPGQPPQVFVTDGEHAWTLRAGGKSELLHDMGAISLLDWACFMSYAYIGRIRSWRSQPVRLPDVGGGPEGIVFGRECVGAHVTTPADTTWVLGFDPDDGRLHGLYEEGPEDFRWKRFGAWKSFGPLILPTVRVSGWRKRDAVEIFTLREARTGERFQPGLFAGSPVLESQPIEVLSALEVVRGSVPGSAYFLLPNVRINDKVECTGQIDTATSTLALQPEVAGLTFLPPRSIATVTGGAGQIRVTQTWVESLDLGAQRLVQLPAHIVRHPALSEIPLSKQPAVTLGGLRFMACAPVLDLSAGTLSRRARPAMSLAKLPEIQAGKAAARAEVISVPFTPVGPAVPLGTITVHVPGSDASLRMFVDTGFAPCLRISSHGLARAKLPADRAAWIARGAIPVHMSGGGNVGGEELLVRLEAFTLGPVTFERPWVMIGLGHMGGAHDPDGLVGAGAWLAFQRVGLDLAGRIIELEPGPAMKKTEDGRWLVPPFGEFLGLTLLAPDPAVAAQATAQAQAAKAPQSDRASLVHATLPRINWVYDGTPAARAGVRRADLLLSIDGLECEGADMSTIGSRIWPPAGKTVRLVVRRGEETRDIVVLP